MSPIQICEENHEYLKKISNSSGRIIIVSFQHFNNYS